HPPFARVQAEGGFFSTHKTDYQKSPVQPTCADGQDTYRTAKLSCCLRQKQAKRSWGSRPNLRARCDARWKFGQRQPSALRVCEAIRPSARFCAEFCLKGSSRAERVQWTKQRRRGWRSAPVFASAHCG